MSEISRLTELLQSTFEGPAWHGAPVLGVLQGVHADTASVQPIEDAHSIWEIVLHMTAWVNGVTDRLNGKEICIEGAKDWPKPGSTEAEWHLTVDLLKAAYRDLVERVGKLTEGELAATAPTGKFTRYTLILGVIQHNLFHAGQIMLMRKALGLPTTPDQE